MTYQEALAYLERHLHLVLNLALERITALMDVLGESNKSPIKLFMLQGTMVRARLPPIFPTHCLQVDYGVGRFTSPP